jgi:hypothetical protein
VLLIEEPVEVSGIELRLSKELASRLDIATGQVLVSGEGVGFARLVESIREEGDTVVLETSQANFSQLGCEGSVEGALNSTGDEADESADVFFAGAQLGNTSIILDANADLTIDPFFEFNTKLEMDGNTGDDNYAVSTWSLCPRAGASFDLWSNGALHLIRIVDLLEVTKPWPVFVGPIPVIFSTSLVGGVGVWGLTNGTLQVSGELEMSGCLEALVTWPADGSLPTVDASGEFDINLHDPYFDATGDVALRIFLNVPDVRACAYGVVCASVGIRVYVDILKDDGKPHALCGGVEAKAQLSAELPWTKSVSGLGLLYWSTDLYRQKLAGDGKCDRGVPGPDLEDEPTPEPVED